MYITSQLHKTKTSNLYLVYHFFLTMLSRPTSPVHSNTCTTALEFTDSTGCPFDLCVLSLSSIISTDSTLRISYK